MCRFFDYHNGGRAGKVGEKSFDEVAQLIQRRIGDDALAMMRKMRASQLAGSCAAVQTSVMTKALARRPFCQLRSRASRKFNANESSPATTSMTRAQCKNSVQRETTAMSASVGGSLLTQRFGNRAKILS
jgi:hypothetical protein